MYIIRRDLSVVSSMPARIAFHVSRRLVLFWFGLAGFSQAMGGFVGTGIEAGRGQATGERADVLLAGASMSNITPKLGVRLDGAIMQIGPATHIHDDLFSRCLVLDNGVKRIAFVICDTTMIATEVVAHAKRLIHQRSGIPPEHVVVSATHTHSSPRALDLALGPANQEYNEFLAERVADGVSRAINNLAPAHLGWGSGQKPEFVQNRRWFVAPENMPANPFGAKTDQVVMGAPRNVRNKPSGPVDPEVYVLSVRHADGRPLAVLANFGLHYVGGIPGARVSADYFGVFADEVQRLLGADRRDPPFVAMMSNGTSGDVVVGDAKLTDPSPKPAVREWAFPRMQEVGEGIAREVQRVSQRIEYRPWVELAAVTSELVLGVRKPDPERLAWANEMAGTIKAGARLTRPQVYAREAQFLADYPATRTVMIQAFRIGDLGIAAIPCEVFAETGLALKQESPFKATFTIELANGYYGYLPPPEQHARGGYETWPARSSFLEIEAETKIRGETLKLLRGLMQR